MFAPLIPLITQMVIEGIAKGSRPVLPHLNSKGIALVGAAVILGFLGLGFALFAGFIYLQNFFAADVAALIVAGGIFFFAAIFGFLGKKSIKGYGYVTYHRAAATHSSSSPVGDIAQTVKNLIEGVTTELEEPIRDNPKTAIALASLAGYLAGDFHKRH